MNQDRRKDENRPADPLVFTDEKLIAAAQEHLRAERTEGCLLAIPGTVPALHVAVGPAAWIAKHAASQSQAVPSELASLDVRYEFERWISGRGEAANYIGDGLYRSGAVTDQAEAFAAGVDVATACIKSPAVNPHELAGQLRIWYGNSESYEAKMARAAADEIERLSHSAATGRAPELPPMLSNVAHVTRRIRRCEGEVAAQVVLEHFAMEYARAALASPAAPLAAAVPEDAELIDLARLFGSAAANGGQVTLPASACAKLFDSMTQVAAVPAEEASACEVPPLAAQLRDIATNYGTGEYISVRPQMLNAAAEVIEHLARLSKPTAQGAALSIDTPEFSRLLSAFKKAQPGYDYSVARADLLTHIDRHIAPVAQQSEAGAPTAAAGYQTVPMVATSEMVHAGIPFFIGRPFPARKAWEVYRAMLAAAPTSGRESAAPEAQQEAKDAERLDWIESAPAGALRIDRCAFAPDYINWGNGRTLRKAIDAAMQKGAQHG